MTTDKRINARWVRGGAYEEAIAQAWVMKVRGASDTEIHEETHAYKDTHCYHDMWRRRIYVEGGYVGEAEWQIVQTQMDERRRHGHAPRLATSAYLLGGLVFCTCGRLMIGHALPRQINGQRKGAYRPGPDAISYYVCPASRQHAGCTMGKLHAATVEQRVLRIILDDILTDTHLATLRAQIKTDLAAAQQSLDAERATLRERQVRLTREINNLKEAIAQGGAIGELVASVRERVTEREDIEEELRQVDRRQEQQDQVLLDDGHWAQLVSFLRDGLSGPTERARSVLQTLVQRIEVWPNKDGLTLQFVLGGPPSAVFVSGTPGATRTPAPGSGGQRSIH